MEAIIIFGNIIYYDDKKISEYSAMVSGKQSIKIKELEIVDDKSAQLNLKIAALDLKGSKKYTAEVQSSLLYNCDSFEKILDGRDDYFDFLRGRFDIKTIGKGNIVKFNASMVVPHEFDVTQTIEKFKPLLIETISSKTTHESEKMALKTFFDLTDAKIPILIELDDVLLCSKLISSNMIVAYEDLEEFEETEITIVARVNSFELMDKKKPFYDPLKDFMRLNRSLRRSIGERTEGLYEIYADQDYKVVDVLAIYQ